MQFVVHIVVSAALLFIMAQLVNGIQVRDARAAIFGALGLGFANAFVRPILVAITLPINILTLGLFSWVISAMMLLLAAWIVDGFEIEGFGTAMLGSFVLGLLNLLAGILLGGAF